MWGWIIGFNQVYCFAYCCKYDLNDSPYNSHFCISHPIKYTKSAWMLVNWLENIIHKLVDRKKKLK